MVRVPPQEFPDTVWFQYDLDTLWGFDRCIGSSFRYRNLYGLRDTLWIRFGYTSEYGLEYEFHYTGLDTISLERGGRKPFCGPPQGKTPVPIWVWNGLTVLNSILESVMKLYSKPYRNHIEFVIIAALLRDEILRNRICPRVELVSESYLPKFGIRQSYI